MGEMFASRLSTSGPSLRPDEGSILVGKASKNPHYRTKTPGRRRLRRVTNFLPSVHCDRSEVIAPGSAPAPSPWPTSPRTSADVERRRMSAPYTVRWSGTTIRLAGNCRCTWARKRPGPATGRGAVARAGAPRSCASDQVQVAGAAQGTQQPGYVVVGGGAGGHGDHRGVHRHEDGVRLTGTGEDGHRVAPAAGVPDASRCTARAGSRSWPRSSRRPGTAPLSR